MVEHAAAGDVDVFWMVGGNFLETLPDTDRSRRALARPRPAHPSRHRAVVGDARRERRRRPDPAGRHALRVRRRGHRDVHRAPHHLLAGDPRPSRSAWRAPSGGCSARPWRASVRTARTTSGSTARRRSAPRSPARFRSTRASRRCSAKGDQVQWGGPALYADGRFATARRPGPFFDGHRLPVWSPACSLAGAATPGARSSSGCPRAAASSSTRWCSATSTR